MKHASIIQPFASELIRANDPVIAAIASGFSGVDLQTTISDLAERVEWIYFHIDAVILDERYSPNQRTK